MQFNIKQIHADYDFVIYGASYIGKPKENTALYISKKVEHLIDNLKSYKNCLVFAETGIEVADDIYKNNCIIFSPKPQYEYAKFANMFMKEKRKQESQLQYTMTKDNYYVGEEVSIGVNAYIEPGCLIGHGVTIGDNAVILSGSVIKNAIIGNNFFCNEQAVIGSSSFTMTEDDEGNRYRIPTLGKVVIGNDVEVGAFDNISAGACGDTIIEDYAKLDALVHIGHEAHLKMNVELTAGVIVGGFAVLEEGTYAGVNSCIKNRIAVGEKSIIGMGSTVIKTVEKGKTVIGNPARVLR